MKTLTRGIAVIAVLTLFNLAVNGQAKKPYEDPKYGVDSTSRMRNAMENSLYREFSKQKNYKDAYPHWLIVYYGAPKISKNLYIDGAKIYKSFIKKDKENRQAWVDSLMGLYDRRIEFYGQKASNLSRKGSDLQRYRKGSDKEVREILGESMDLGKTKTSHITINNYMLASTNLFKADELEGGVVVEDYAKCVDLADAIIAKKPTNEKIKKVRTGLDKLFEESGAATSESVVSLFAPRYEANPEDKDLLLQIVRLLDMTEGTDEELFFKASESLYKIDPSASAAYALARMFKAQGESEKAKNYFIEAIEKQEDLVKKAEYQVQLADIMKTNFNNPKSARMYCKQAIKNDPNSGQPYMMLGIIYGGATDCTGETPVAKRAIYWVAVDMFKIAKKKDPSLAEQADKFVATYSQHFPKTTELFFEDITEGSSYTVKCWINETTKARAKK